MKPIAMKNMLNGESLICPDRRAVQVIDGVEYLIVRRPGSDRQFLMRKEVLVKDDTKTVAKNPQPS